MTLCLQRRGRDSQHTRTSLLDEARGVTARRSVRGFSANRKLPSIGNKSRGLIGLPPGEKSRRRSAIARDLVCGTASAAGSSR